MRFLVAIIIVLLGFSAGCRRGDDAPQFKAVTGKKLSARTATATVIDPSSSTNRPMVRPSNVLTGRIVAVREPLRFAIIDFASGRMPQLDQRLNVYRLDQKVAELRVSGPYLGTTVAADVTAGQALVGDLVRDR